MTDVARLFEGWRAGSEADGDALLRALFPELFRFFRSKVAGDVDDLIQRTLLDCLESSHSVRDAAHFRGFVFRVARNRLFDRLRDEVRCGPQVDLSDVSLQQLGASPSSVVAGNERRQLVTEALRRIPLDQQIALELTYWHGMSAPQIAEVLDANPNTVRTRITRARAALRAELRTMGAGEEPDEESLLR